MTKKIPEEDLIEELHRLADELGRPPTAREMRAEGKYSTSAYQNRFGSWNGAVESAGLDSGGTPPRVSDQNLISELRRLADELEKTPTYTDIGERTDHSASTYQRRFGSWNAALNAAGLKPNRSGVISDQDLIDELHRLADEYGETPSKSVMEECGKYSATPYKSHFGSWNAALDAAGLEPVYTGEATDQDLIEELQRLEEEFGKVPSRTMMLKHGEYSPTTYRKKFGSWNAAMEAGGFGTWSDPTGEDHPHWNGGVFPYGTGWHEAKKERVRERDGRCCQECGRSEEKHIEKFGRKHAVHHIIPARSFDDPEKRNDPENLITLCCGSCHSKWERMAPLRPQTAGVGKVTSD